MVFNRLVNPKSKLQVNEWAKNQFIPYETSVPLLKVHHYYRALDYRGSQETYRDRYLPESG